MTSDETAQGFRFAISLRKLAKLIYPFMVFGKRL